MKSKLLIGITGSFCNHQRVLYEISKLVDDYDITFVFTKNVLAYDTRYSSVLDLLDECRKISSQPFICNIVEAEKVGPNDLYDLMAIIPCSANSLSRLVHGAYDCPVTLCAKAMIRNNKNIIVGVSSNDILGISGENFMKLINMKHFYVLPIYQDDYVLKPKSCTSYYELLDETLQLAKQSIQIQPILREKKR